MESIKKGLDGFFIPATPESIKSTGHYEPIGRINLTCVIYFQGGHLPEVQDMACQCLKEYIQITGQETRSCVGDNGRIVKRSEKGLPLLTKEKVSQQQEKGNKYASYLASSNRTINEYKLMPPEYMVSLDLKFKPLIV